MIIGNSERRINFIGRLYQILIALAKFAAIYLVLSMAWSFSITLVVVMLLVLFFMYRIAKFTDIQKTDMPITPLNELTPGVRKIKGRISTIETVSAPLNGCLCVGYTYDIYDINDAGEIQLPALKSETVCKDFIVSADGHRVHVDSKEIHLSMFSGEVERIINNQKHIQHTLDINEEVVVIGDAVSDINNTYKLIYSTKNPNLLVMKSEDVPLFEDLDKTPQRLLNLWIFIPAIVTSLILMANLYSQADNQMVLLFDLNQILLGDIIHLFSQPLSLTIIVPQYLYPLFDMSLLLVAGLTTIGSYVIFYLLLKLSKFLAKRGCNLLNYFSFSLSFIILIAGIFSLIAGIILFLFSANFIAIKLLMIWFTVFIFGLINFIFFNFFSRFG